MKKDQSQQMRSQVQSSQQVQSQRVPTTKDLVRCDMTRKAVTDHEIFLGRERTEGKGLKCSYDRYREESEVKKLGARGPQAEGWFDRTRGYAPLQKIP